MANNRVDITLAFQADTQKAKQNLLDLQKTLQEVSKLPANSQAFFNDQEFKKASQAALELQKHMAAALNPKTGNIDLSRLTTSLKSAGTDLATLTNKFKYAGEAGQQAFLQVAKSISYAETPAIRLNGTLTKFAATMKQTVRYQLTNSMYRGITSAISSAYNYAKDLNESLNNIRIVTGQSTSEMAKFAKEANLAAKALGTTTTAYTDAALIFAQQGLKGDEITKRTEAVVKMSQVTGQSATEVSSQMTAIWNNFAKGSDNLEHFSDVVTALGAATASSSSEIATGLEKFASVAETVGLSYETATASLATVVAETRQSADVVGTAFKTIFARMQGLQLDGEEAVELNKYSKALQDVGVNILEADGQLKKLDVILPEIANKWQILGDAQKTALAQSVAGTRQYAQFMALMNNWDKVEANIRIAEISDGTLQQQQDIYAESWEAASKRVKASLESVYDSLLNAEGFIAFTDNIINPFINGIDGIVKSLGGLKGVLQTVAAVFLSSYAKKMPQTLDTLKQNIIVVGQTMRTAFTGKETTMTQAQSGVINQLQEIQNSSAYNDTFKQQAKGMEQLIRMRQKMVAASEKMSEADRLNYEQTLQLVEALQKERAELEGLYQEASQIASDSKTQLIQSNPNMNSHGEIGTDALETEEAQLKAEQDKLNQTPDITEEDVARLDEIKNRLTEIEQIKNNISKSNLEKTTNGNAIASDAVKEQLNTFEQLVQKETEAASAKEELIIQQDELNKVFDNGLNIQNNSAEYDQLKEKVLGYVESIQIENIATEDNKNTINNLINTLKKMENGEISAATAIETYTTLQQAAAETTNERKRKTNELIEKMKELGYTEEEINNHREAVKYKTNFNIERKKQDKNLDDIEGENDPTNIKVNPVKMSQAVTQLASSAMSASMAITSLQNAWNTFWDKDANAFQKIGAVIGALSSCAFAIQGVSSGIRILSQTSKFAAVGEEEYRIAIAKAETELERESLAVKKNAASKRAAAKSMAGIALVFIGVSLAISAITSSLEHSKEAWEKDATAAKNASEAASELTKNYEDIKNKYQSLVDSINSYKDLKTGLYGLIEGTQEYKDKLNEVNQAGIEVIETLSNMGYAVDHYWKDGQLIINQASLTQAQEAQQHKVNEAQYSAAMGQINAKDANTKAKETSAIRAENSGFVEGAAANLGGVNGTDIGKATLGGAAIGATALAGVGASLGGSLGTVVPIVGNLIGAALGAIVGVTIGSIAMIAGDRFEEANEKYEQQQRNAINKISQDYIQYGEEALEKENLVKRGITSTNKEYIESIKEIARETANATTAMKTAIHENIIPMLEEIDSYNNSNHKDEVANAVTNAVSNEQKKQTEKITETYDKYDEDELENAATKYLSNVLKLKDVSDIKVEEGEGSTAKIKYTYLDDDNKAQESYVMAETLISDEASKAAQKILPEITEKIVKILDDKSKNSGAQAFLSDENHSFSSATISDVKDFVTVEDNKTWNDEQIKNNIIKEYGGIREAEQIFSKSIDEIISEIHTQYNNMINSKNDIYNNLLSMYNKDFEGLNFDNFSINELSQLDRNLTFAKYNSSEEKSEEITSLMTELKNSGQLSDYAKALATLDFQGSTITVSNFLDAMESFGVELDWTDDQVNILLKSMQGLGENSTDIANKFKEINDIIKDLDFGDTISQENFDKLDNNMKIFFEKTLEGTYRLITSAELLQATAKSEAIEKLNRNDNTKINQLKNNNSILEKSKDKDFSKLNTSQYSQINLSDYAENLFEKYKKDNESFYYNDFNSNYTFVRSRALSKNGRYNNQAIQNRYNNLQNILRHNYDLDSVKKLAPDALAIWAATTDSSQYEVFRRINELKSKLKNNTLTKDDVQEIYENVNSSLSNIETINEKNEQLKKEITEDQMMIAGSFDNLEDLQNNYKIDSEDEILANIQRGAFNQRAWELDEQEETAGLDTTEIQEYSDWVQTASENSSYFSENLKEDDQAAKDVAASILRLNRGVATLGKEFYDSSKKTDGWYDILKKSSKESLEYSKAMSGTKAALSDLTGVSKEFITNDFVSKNLDLVKKAASGSAEAIDELKSKIATDSVAEVIAKQLGDSAKDVESNTKKLQDLINDFDGQDIEIGAQLFGEDEFVQTLNRMIEETGMSVDQINALCDSMGFETNFVQEDEVTETTVPEYTTHHQVSKPSNVEVGGTGMPGTGIMMQEFDEVTWTEETGRKPVKGTIPAFAMSTDGKPPKIKSLTKTATGSANDSSSSNPGGKPKSSKKSGGGKKNKEKKEQLFDPFHNIDRTINKMSKDLTDLEAVQDKVFGISYINNLKEQNKLLEKQRELYRKRAKETYQYNIKKSMKDLEQYSFSKTKVKFDPTFGVDPKSYRKLAQDAQKEVDSLTDIYNKNKTDKNKERLDNAKEQAKNLNSIVSEIEANADKLREMFEADRDAYFQELENKLKTTEYKIQIKLDVEEAEIKLKNWIKDAKTNFLGTRGKYGINNNTALELKTLQDTQKNRLNKFNEQKSEYDNAVDLKERVKNLTNKDLKRMIGKNATKEDKKLVKLLESKGINVDFSKGAQAIKDGVNDYINKQGDKLAEIAEEYKAAYQEAVSKYLEIVSQVAEAWSDIEDDLSKIAEDLDYYSKLNDLYYGEGTSAYYNNKMAINQAKEQAAQEKIKTGKKQQEDYQILMDNKRNKMDENAFSEWLKSNKFYKEDNEESRTAFLRQDDDYKQFEEGFEKGKKLEREGIIEGAEAAQEIFESTIDHAFDQAEQQMFNGYTADEVSEQWELKKESAQGYYDSVQKIYQIESMESKWQALIYKSSSIKAQEKLTNLMKKQQEYLQNKVNLSEKDIQIAERELKVEEARVALEEAQKNKSSMKLVRDSNGNWNYQYVQDTNAVNEAQQRVYDAENDMRDTALQAKEEGEAQLLERWKKYRSRNSALEKRLGAVGLSKEEEQIIKDQIAENNRSYEEDFNKISSSISGYTTKTNQATGAMVFDMYNNGNIKYEDLSDTEKDLIDLMNRDGGFDGDFYTMSDDIISKANNLNEAIVGTWKTILSETVNSLNTGKTNIGNIMNEITTMCTNAINTFKMKANEAEELSGDSFISNFAKVINQIVTDINSIPNKIEKVVSTSSSLADAQETVDAYRAAWTIIADETGNVLQNIYNIKNETKKKIKLKLDTKQADTAFENWLKKIKANKTQTITLKVNTDYQKTPNADGNDKDTNGAGNLKLDPSGLKFKGLTSNKNKNGKISWGLGKESSYEGISTEQAEKFIKDIKLYKKAYKWTKNVKTSNASPEEAEEYRKSYNNFFKDNKSILKELGIKTQKELNKFIDQKGISTLSAFDTGGYTGDWNSSEGRLALLHKKELVLNKEDTANMLSMINIVRDLVDQQLPQKLMQNMYQKIKGALIDYSGVISSNNNSSSENIFNISAEFPNASNAAEIQEAILSLPNLASQYLNRRR